MQEKRERNINFLFPDECHVLRYEDSKFHKEKMMPLQHTHAADFVCCNDSIAMILEVKRYTEKPFVNTGENLAIFIDAVGWQFRDTLCGIALAKIHKDEELAPYYKIIFSEKKFPVKLCLFIELENIRPGIHKHEIIAAILNKLKQRFTVMGFAVHVVDSETLSSKCPWKAEVLPCN